MDFDELLYHNIAKKSLDQTHSYFQFSFTIILKVFQKYLLELDKKKYFPTILLDTNFSFDMFEEDDKQAPFATLKELFLNEIMHHPEFTDDKTSILQARESDANSSILNLLSTFPTIQKNLLSAYLKTNVNYKNLFEIKSLLVLEHYNSICDIFYETCKMFLNVYFKSIEIQKNKFKDIIKDKIKKYLKDTYVQFLKQVLVLFSEISNLESILEKPSKQFSHSLETRLIETKLYLEEFLNVNVNQKLLTNTTIENKVQESSANNFQIHEIQKLKQNLTYGGSTSSLLILQQIEKDLEKSSQRPVYNLNTETFTENPNFIQLSETVKNLKTQLENYELQFMDIKEEIQGMMNRTYEEFLKKQKLEKNETVKIILQEFTPKLKENEKLVKEIGEELIKKLVFQETILNGLQREIEEQKKQFKDYNLKLDLCLKSFDDQTLTALKNVKNKIFKQLKNNIDAKILGLMEL
jgi:hypothetical protein